MVYSDKQTNLVVSLSIMIKNTIDLFDSKTDEVTDCDLLLIRFNTKIMKDIQLLALYRSPSSSPSIFVENLNNWLKT